MAKQKVNQIKVEKDEKGFFLNLNDAPANASFVIEQDVDGVEENKDKGIHQIKTNVVEKRVTKSFVETIEGLGINEKGYCELLKVRVVGFVTEKEQADTTDAITE